MDISSIGHPKTHAQTRRALTRPSRGVNRTIPKDTFFVPLHFPPSQSTPAPSHVLSTEGPATDADNPTYNTFHMGTISPHQPHVQQSQLIEHLVVSSHSEESVIAPVNSLTRTTLGYFTLSYYLHRLLTQSRLQK
ncbi:hypothetical protein DL93DRAFT_940210 [Clavulina sp. PMI_390]|nr:hypothetical protein DL93DRAFT_940210 [Clavulina sp. PMI_390]